MKLGIFSRSDLDRLIGLQGGPHVSIYLPAPPSLAETQQDRIRLANLTKSAHETLTEHWMNEVSARRFLKPLDELARDTDILKPRRCGLAVFLSDQCLEVYRGENLTDPGLTVATRFRVRGLLPSLEHLRIYYVLTLSRNATVLYQGSPWALVKLTPSQWPSGYAQQQEVFWADPGQQVHAAASSIKGKQGAVFHGQGGRADHEKADLENYLRRLDDALAAATADHPLAPVILAGVDSMRATFRALTQRATVLEPGLVGNVDRMPVDEVHQRTLRIADTEYAHRRSEVARLIAEHEIPMTGDPEQILVAAAKGRIDTLFFDRSAQLNGNFDPEHGALKELSRQPSGAPGDNSHDLIEWAAVQTIQSGGEVHAVDADEMPASKRMVAALRF